MSETQLTQEQPEAATPAPQAAPNETPTTVDESWADVGANGLVVVNPNPEPEPEPEAQVDTTPVVSESPQPAEQPAIETPATIVDTDAATSGVQVIAPAELQSTELEGETIAEVHAESKEPVTQAENVPAHVGLLGGAALLAAGVAARFKRSKKA